MCPVGRRLYVQRTGGAQSVHVSTFQGTITLILATDMARHGEILDSFKQKVDGFDYTDEEHMTCVRNAPSLPLPVSDKAPPIRLEILTAWKCVFLPGFPTLMRYRVSVFTIRLLSDTGRNQPFVNK